MAKATSKVPVTAEKKKTTPKKAVSSTDKKAGSSTDLIIKACEVALVKLSELDLDQQLQSEINWCLASFQNDHNPIGLYQMAERSLIVLKAELAKKSKGITAKLVGDIEKAIQADR